DRNFAFNWLAFFRTNKSASPPDSHAALNAGLALANFGIEAELGLGAFYVFNEVPKRIRKRLVRDSYDRPVAGWGLWIEEEFIISWYVIVILNIIPAIALFVGVFQSSKHGLTWFAVSAYGVALSAFVFSQW